MNRFIEYETLDGERIKLITDLKFEFIKEGGTYYICGNRVMPDEYKRVRGVLSSIDELIPKSRVPNKE